MFPPSKIPLIPRLQPSRWGTRPIVDQLPRQEGGGGQERGAINSHIVSGIEK